MSKFFLLWSQKLKTWLLSSNTKEFGTHLGKISFSKRTLQKGLVSTPKEELFVTFPVWEKTSLKFPRESQIIYPKDVGALLILGDVFCGAKVLEIGTGTGIFTLWLARFLGEKGEIVSIDNREIALKRAQENIERYQKIYPSLSLPKITFLLKDVSRTKKIPGKFDTVFVDLPEPEKALPLAFSALQKGRPALFVIPTVYQLDRVLQKSKEVGFRYGGITEVWQREWQVKPRSLRPKDRMVSHTAFLLRLFKPGVS